MRGLVISPQLIKKDDFLLIHRSIDPIKLRQYLLYWDKLDFPVNNYFKVEDNSPEIQYLQNVGILKRTELEFEELYGEIEIEEIFLWSINNAFTINNEIDKGRWSMSQPNSVLHLQKDSGIMDRCIEVELYESIPIPSPDIALDDVLNFKEKRKTELLEFRTLMDEFYLSMINSKDIPREKVKIIDKVQYSIISLNKVMNEAKIKRFLGSVKIRIDINEIIRDTALGAFAGAKFNYPMAGAALGLASSIIKVQSEIVLKPKIIPGNLRDYAYLYYAEKELW